MTEGDKQIAALEAEIDANRPAPGTRGVTAEPLKSYRFPLEDVPGRRSSSRGYYYTNRPNTAGLNEQNVRKFLNYVESRGPTGMTLEELLRTTETPPEFIKDLESRGLIKLDQVSTGGPYPKVTGSYVRVPPGTKSKLGIMGNLMGEGGFIRGAARRPASGTGLSASEKRILDLAEKIPLDESSEYSFHVRNAARQIRQRQLERAAEDVRRPFAPARSVAARALSAPVAVATPLLDYGLDTESRTPEQFARAREEEITGMVPGLVSPSELPPAAVLPTDRRKAVESTQGMVGVAPDPESDNVTEQEVRAYISNKVAKGDRLPSWAKRITSFKNGRLVVKPVNPRSRARKGAAERMKD